MRMSDPDRREFLLNAGGGFGAIACANLFSQENLKAAEQIHASHFPAKAKQVIYLFMHGGPSHVDLFDPKPALTKYSGQPLPESFGQVMTRRKVAKNPLLASLKPFRKRGESGLEISDFLPCISQCADELCVLRSCHGDSVNHPQSVYQMNTGSILMGKPSLGSWVSYGLGTENRNLPSFVVMPDRGAGIKGGPPAWGSQTPILHLDRPQGMTADRQRKLLDFINEQNREHLQQRDADSELSARIDAYELAYRMQSAAPDAMDISQETRATRAMYGLDQKETNEFGTRCLLARRMIERGVRFVQLYSGDTNGWDAHKDVLKNHSYYCQATDQPVAALIKDLKQRGLLDETLVIWGGEFGRMPMSEQGTGRDHNPWGYTVWMAGGGVKGGMTYGATDDVGLRAAENPVHVHDLHATILHLLGMDHESLTYFHNGREQRLTDVAGHVIEEVLA